MARDNTPSLPEDEAGDGSVATAAAGIEELLSREDPQTSAALPTKKGKAPVTGLDEDEDEDSPAPGDNPLVDDDEDEPEPPVEEEEEHEEDDDEPDAPASKREPRVKVTVDGEEEEVPLSEALAGYSRTASFTKKSQKLAEERRAHEANVATKESELRAQAEHYTSRLSALEEALAQREPNWEEIQRTQPDRFAEIHAAWQLHKDNLAKLANEKAVEQRKLATANEKARVARVDAAVAKVGETVPEWVDTTAKGTAFRKAVYDYGIKNGFTDQELTGIDDARSIKTLINAYLYDKAVADKAARQAVGKTKVETLKQTLKPGAQNTPVTSKRSTKRTVVAGLKAQAKKSGSVHDAAAAIEAMLE